MANTVQTQVILDGSKDSVIKVYLKSDGAAGELSNVVIADPATLAPIADGRAATSLSIVRIWHDLAGFDLLLKFDATTPVGAWKCTQTGAGVMVDFEFFKGIPNNAGAGKNGKITLDTAGFTTSTDEGTLLVHLRKD